MGSFIASAVGSFTNRDDVSVARTESGGSSTVTITVGRATAQWADSTSSYLLPQVSPVVDDGEAQRKAMELEQQLAQARADLEEASRRKLALESAQQETQGTVTRLPLSAGTMARLSAEGGIAWSKEGDKEGSPTFSYYNLYRTGEPLEAVQATADAAFGALSQWLTEQQSQAELAFFTERDRLQRWAAADKAAAMEALRAEAAAAQAAALSRQEAALASEREAALAALRSSLEAQMRAAALAAEQKLAQELSAQTAAAALATVAAAASATFVAVSCTSVATGTAAVAFAATASASCLALVAASAVAAFSPRFFSAVVIFSATFLISSADACTAFSAAATEALANSTSCLPTATSTSRAASLSAIR
jgi:hypothetical protein